jgi:microsomal epoxide hydrolase
MTTESAKPEPFAIAVAPAAIADLKRRLARTRWPNEPENRDWRFGSERASVRRLVEHWREIYDWPAEEAKLNAFPHYSVEIEAPGQQRQRLHYLHEPGSGLVPQPLLLIHGWPSSFYEFLPVIEALAHPDRFDGDEAEAFDVVVVSLPGYGFSPPPAKPLGPRAMASLCQTLMTKVLGYRHFIVHGNDWGAAVASYLGLEWPQTLAGLSLQSLPLAPWQGPGSVPLTQPEQEFLARLRRYWREEIGHQAIQATKPQTLAFALTDSPAGLVGWLLEKFRSLADTSGNLERRFSRDQLCTMLSLYWFTAAIGPASWPFYAARQDGSLRLKAGQRVGVSTGYMAFPLADLPRPPRVWVERMYEVRRWSELDAGGHFAALEEPELFIEEIRAFSRSL